MRRFAALVTLLLLSSLRVGATAPVQARVAASVARPAREMVAASPSARLAPIAQRELSPRGPMRLLVPWSPLRGESSIALAGSISGRVAAPSRPATLPVALAHRLTYDATAPPRLS